MGSTWKVAAEALLAYKLRAFLSTIGVAIGSASIVLVVTAGLFGGRYVVAQIEGVGSNLVYAQHFPNSKPVRTVTGSQLNGVLVEIDVVAYLGPEHA